MSKNISSRSNSKSLSQLDKEIDQLIDQELKNRNELNSIKNVLFEEEEFTDKIPEDLDNKVLEIAEGRELDLVNSKKKKKKSLDILNEHIDDLYQKTINESKEETKGADSISKNSKLGKKRIRNINRKAKDSDEEYELSFESENKSVNSFMNDNSDYERDYYYQKDDPSNISEEDKELIDFVNRKTFPQKKSLLKYKEIYNKKKNHLIVLDEDKNKEEKIQNKIIEDKQSTEENKKRFKRLKKNTDNKEMQLPLDTECIICTCIINELANPDGCNHNFCKTCLIEWSQRSNKCPMCKKAYLNLYTYEKGEKNRISINEIRAKYKTVISSEESGNDEEEEILEDLSDVGCYICGKNTEPEKMLICDRCQSNCCHFYCNNLKKIPEGNWYCGYCLEEIKQIKLQKKKIGQFFL